MKNTLILLFLLPFMFISCGEDEENFVQQNYLVGKWEISQIGSKSSAGAILYKDYENAANCDKDNYIFNNDFTFENNDYTNTGSCTNDKIAGSYERNSTFVTLNYTIEIDNESKQVSNSYTIISLTFTEAIIAYTDKSSKQIVYLKLTKV